MRAGELDEFDEPCAAVVFWHSLEHLRDAGAALERAAGLLEPRGVARDRDAEPAAASRRGCSATAGSRLDLPRHLVHVPAQALLARLRALGLRVERISYLRGGQVVFGWLHGIVGALPGQPGPLRRDPPAGGPPTDAVSGATPP